MMTVNALDDVSHWFGSDLVLSATGDLGRSNGNDRSQQRVLRRLMTNPGDYLAHPAYGAGLAQHVGEVLDLAAVSGLIKGQLKLEASVARAPAPVVDVEPIAEGLTVSISYTSLPDRQPVALSFDVNV